MLFLIIYLVAVDLRAAGLRKGEIRSTISYSTEHEDTTSDNTETTVEKTTANENTSIITAISPFKNGTGKPGKDSDATTTTLRVIDITSNKLETVTTPSKGK